MGTKEGLAHLLLAVLSPGSTVLVPTPAYPVHTAAVFLAGASFVGVPIDQSDNFFKRFSQRFENTWPRPTMAIMSFPHNPTTTVVDKSFWERLLSFCKKKNIFLVHDFAYADLVFDSSAAQSVLSVPGAKELAVETYSLSKGFGMGGWRIGVVAGCPELVAALKRIKGYLDFGAFQPLQLGAAAVLEQPHAELEESISETVEEYRSRRDCLAVGLQRMGWDVHVPRGSIFLWARLPEGLREMGSLESARLLLEGAQVAICPGEGFDIDAREYMRFALVEAEPRIHMALKRMEAFIGQGEEITPARKIA
ncbi:UNVERIFIED_CONTAM: hypothetical protein GTU68_020237 [Idotea baltica]|nr:hypothetical protein [Idotea baltica]